MCIRDSYTYDANGNLLSGGGRTLTWNAENQPSQVVSGGLTEAYTYDADGARVTRSATPGLSTRFAFGLYELEGSVTRSYYALAGQVVALRDSGLGLSSLYGDQGVDVYMSPLGSWLLPPTVYRQHSLWVDLSGDVSYKICDCELPILTEKLVQYIRKMQE